MPFNFYSSALITSNVIGAWDAYLLVRQRRSFIKNTAVPELFKDVLTAESYEKAQHYGTETTTFSLIKLVTETAVSTLSLLGKFTSKLYKFVAQRSGLTVGSFAHLYAFGVAADVAGVLVELPFSYYETFVLEQKHGFNKTTKLQFFKDIFISFALRVTLLHPTQTALIQFVVDKFGERFPLYLFAGFSTLMIGFILIFPTVIQPLFNKFTPIAEDTSLYAGIKQLADKVGFPIYKVLEVDGSRRSAHSNAYLFGLGRHKRIVLYDTLLQQSGEDQEQVFAVLCHEMGHWKHSHMVVTFGIAFLQLLGFSYGAKAVIFNPNMYEQFGFSDMNAVIGFTIFAEVLVSPFSSFFGYIMSVVTRTMEFQADRFAVEMGYADALKRALMTVSKENKECLVPDPLVSALTYSHPPTLERIAAIDVTAVRQQKKSD